MAGRTPTSVSPFDMMSTEQPTPQYGQIERVSVISPGVFTCCSARRSPSAPVGQVCTHWPQKVQAESRSMPSNSVVICVWKPRLAMLMA